MVNPSLVNELLVGYNQIAIVNDTLDWAASGTPTRRSASRRTTNRGPQLADVDGGLTSAGRRRERSDTLDKTYQLNEKLTWLKGRHTMKFGGQFLHYVQQRFYAGNNGLLGLFGYNAAFFGFAFSDFLLDQVDEQGTRQPSRRHGRTSTTASRSTCRTISRRRRPSP